VRVGRLTSSATRVMMKMITLALLAAAGVQAAPNTSRRQMQDACADVTGDSMVDVADLLALLAGAASSFLSGLISNLPSHPPRPAPRHHRSHGLVVPTRFVALTRYVVCVLSHSLRSEHGRRHERRRRDRRH
jgi:hypothetical protein